MMEQTQTPQSSIDTAPADVEREGVEAAEAAQAEAAAEPVEQHPDQIVQDVGMDLVTRLLALAGAVQIYDLNNAAVLRLVDAVVETIEGYHQKTGEALALILLEEALTIGGRLVRMDTQLYLRAKKLAGLFHRFELRSMTFEVGCAREHILPFVADLAASQRAGEARLKFEGYPKLGLGRSGGQLVASTMMEDQELAGSLFASLTELTTALLTEHAEGRTPSLSTLKRTLERVLIDMEERAGVYRALSAASRRAAVPEAARLRVTVAIDAMGLGLFIGLSREDAAVLGLAGILAGLSDSAEPAEAIAPILTFGGLGEASVPLVLAVYDSRAARLGKPAGIPGRLLTTVEAYHRLTAPRDGHPRLPPHAALAAMCAGEVKGVEKGPARFFADYYGPFPIGSTVHLSDGRDAVVIAHGTGEKGKRRPVVGIVDQRGDVGERADLQTQPTLKIRGIPEQAVGPWTAEGGDELGALPQSDAAQTVEPAADEAISAEAAKGDEALPVDAAADDDMDIEVLIDLGDLDDELDDFLAADALSPLEVESPVTSEVAGSPSGPSVDAEAAPKAKSNPPCPSPSVETEAQVDAPGPSPQVAAAPPPAAPKVPTARQLARAAKKAQRAADEALAKAQAQAREAAGHVQRARAAAVAAKDAKQALDALPEGTLEGVRGAAQSALSRAAARAMELKAVAEEGAARAAEMRATAKRALAMASRLGRAAERAAEQER